MNMELRSYNVERIYNEVVTCRIGDKIGVRKEMLEKYKGDIRSMLLQLKPFKLGVTVLYRCNIRTDDETWTPYLQIVEMLILLGEKIGMVSIGGKLSSSTFIRFTYLDF